MSSYAYLGVVFACNGAWDVHLKRVLDKKVNQFHSVMVVSSMEVRFGDVIRVRLML